MGRCLRPVRAAVRELRNALSIPAIILAVTLAISGLAQATVTVTDNGNGTATMANQLISVTISESSGEVESIISNAYPGVNLVASGGIGLELTHIGAGPETSASNDYWTDITAGGTEVYSVVENSGTMVDVQIRNPTACPDLTTYPNGLWDWSIHHVMFDNDSGFYTYHVWRHNASQPESYWTADSWQGYTNGSIFAASPVNTAWDFCGVQKIGVSIGYTGANATNEGVPAEVNILPLTSYYTQPTGQYYEANWPIYTPPTGLTYMLYPAWTKYDWPTYLGPYTSYRNTWGVANDLIGIWHCNGSSEWRNGGPTKLSGAMSGDYLYCDDVEGHALGATNTTVPAGAVYEKLVGPFFTYVNTGSNHNQLWADAQARGAQEAARWPYSWVNESESDYNRNRGTVTGQITAATGQSTANAVVILGQPLTSITPDWIWQGCLNYLYWTTADAYGNFTIPKVDPGTYTLFSYVPGVFVSGSTSGLNNTLSINGEYVQNNVTVTANQTTNLGTISWNPPRAQSLLFQLGIPDRSTEEYRFGNLMKQFGLWWRYDSEMGTNTLNFNVGQSNVANDWYYAQPIFAVAGGTYAEPKWNINFNLASVPTSPVVLTVDLAGGYGTTFYTYVNGVNETPSPYQSTGIYTNSGADIYRDVVQVGQWQQYVVTLPSSAFKTGSNTFQLQVRQGGFSGTWDTSGGWPDLVAGGLMYDAIKLEAGPQSTQLIQNGTYKMTSGTNGFVAAVESGSNTANTPVVEWPFLFETSQEWTITDLGNDVYSIIAVNSGMALSVQNSSTSVGAGIVQSPYTGATSQQWHAVLNTSGGLSFINQNSGLALDITGRRSDYQNNVQLIQNTSNNGLSQGWYVTPQTYGPPDVATGLTAIAGNGQANLSWTASERGTSYTIMRGTSSGNETTMVANNVTGTTFTDTGVTNGVTYYYVVVAVTSTGGSSPNSNEASTEPVPPVPVAPAGLFAGPGNGAALLSWQASQNASSYIVLRGTASGGESTLAANNIAANTYNNTGLANGVTYYYVVEAANLSGTSGQSNEASVAPTTGAPATPSNLAATPGNGAVDLTWTASAEAGSYIILRGTASGVYPTSVTISAGSTSYLDTSVTNGTTYYYVVEASNTNATTGNSNQVSVVPAYNPPAAPTGLTATGSNQQVSLAWNASTGATGYMLVRGTTSGVYPVTVAANTATRAFTDTGLLNGTTYYYAVAAIELGGTSAYSTQASETPSRTAGTLYWTGNSNEFWDTTTSNWQYGSGATTFQNGDSLVFGNGGANANVYLTKSVSPGNMTFNATNVNYGIGGIGSITGTTGLTFDGNNTTLTIGVANSYSGQTTIQNGTLYMSSPGTLGSSNIVFNNATLASTSYGNNAVLTSGGSTLTMAGNTFSVAAGQTGTIIMAPSMTMGPVKGAGTMNMVATSTGTTTKAESLCGTWGGSFTGTLNISGTTGSLLTGYYNGGSPNFDGNLGNATVNLNNVGICSWDNSGGNTLTLGTVNATSTVSIIGSAYAGGLTVSIGGLNTNSVFAGSITNTAGGGNTSLVKTGTGSLTLSGSCNYNGATSVNGGKLLVNGLVSGSGNAVTVASGASLGGTGSIAETLTVNSGAGLLLSSTGNLTVTGNVTFGGSISVAPASTSIIGPGTYTLLVYTGTETGTPTFTYVPPHGVNQSATFNTETPGQITVQITGPPAAPSGLAATAGNGQVLLSWTGSPSATSYLIQRGTSSGGETTTVSGTDTAASFTDSGVTNGITYYYVVTASNAYGLGGTSNEASATPTQTFSEWIAAAFPGVTATNIIGMTATPEHDGVSNLMKYFMGINPASSSYVDPLTCGPDGQGDIVLYFRMSKNLTGVSYSIDQSSNLSTWTSTGLQGTVVADMGTYYSMKVVVPMAGNTNLFLRLSVSSP
jgi:autotransporter-associated beta strand protein